MPELAFLTPRHRLAGDLARALCREVGRQDAAALLVDEPPPPRPDRVCVVVAEGEWSGVEAGLDLARTILVVLTPPDDPAFAELTRVAGEAGAVFHVNSTAAGCLREEEVEARHLQLGFADDWAELDPAADRDLEVAPADDPALLARAQLTTLRGGYFDWPRALGAMHRGAVVLHERSVGMAPLVAGRHLFVAAGGSMEAVAAALLRDPDRLAAVRREAFEFLRDALPLSLGAAALLGGARALVAQAPASAGVSTPGQATLRSK